MARSEEVQRIAPSRAKPAMFTQPEVFFQGDLQDMGADPETSFERPILGARWLFGGPGQGRRRALGEARNALIFSFVAVFCAACSALGGGGAGASAASGSCPTGGDCSPEADGGGGGDVPAAAAKRAGARGAARPWSRGGAGPGRPLEVVGPAAAPSVVWEVELGAAITGTPALATLQGEPAAFVGTHAGRFVGVPLAGPQAGRVALDLNVPGLIWGSPAVDGEGRLIVGADDDVLYAIDPDAAAIVWRRRLGACEPPRAPGPEGSRCDPDGGPTIGPGGGIYVGADGIYHLDDDGTIRWHFPKEAGEEPDREGGADPGIAARAAHVGAAPLVAADGSLFVGAQDGGLIALDREGALRWRVELGPDVDAAPVMLSSGVVVAAADDGRVIAVDPAGALRWTFTAGRDVRAPLAVAADDTIYAAALDGVLYAIRPDGALRWSYAAGDAIASAPIVDAEGSVYFGARDDFIRALDRRGRERWRYELPEDVDAAVAIAEDGLLIVGCDDGVLRALR